MNERRIALEAPRYRLAEAEARGLSSVSARRWWPGNIYDGERVERPRRQA